MQRGNSVNQPIDFSEIPIDLSDLSGKKPGEQLTEQEQLAKEIKSAYISICERTKDFDKEIANLIPGLVSFAEYISPQINDIERYKQQQEKHLTDEKITRTKKIKEKNKKSAKITSQTEIGKLNNEIETLKSEIKILNRQSEFKIEFLKEYIELINSLKLNDFLPPLTNANKLSGIQDYIKALKILFNAQENKEKNSIYDKLAILCLLENLRVKISEFLALYLNDLDKKNKNTPFLSFSAVETEEKFINNSKLWETVYSNALYRSNKALTQILPGIADLKKDINKYLIKLELYVKNYQKELTENQRQHILELKETNEQVQYIKKISKNVSKTFDAFIAPPDDLTLETNISNISKGFKDRVHAPIENKNKLINLQSELNIQKSTISELSNEITKINNTLLSKSNELENLNKQFSEAKNKNIILESESKEKEAEINAIQQEIEAIRTQRDNFIKTLNQLEDQIKEKMDEITNQQRVITDQKEKIHEITEELTSANNEINNLKNQAEVQKQNINKLTDELTVKNNENTITAKTLNTQINTNRKIVGEIETLKQEIANLQQTNAELENTNTKLMSKQPKPRQSVFSRHIALITATTLTWAFAGAGIGATIGALAGIPFFGLGAVLGGAALAGIGFAAGAIAGFVSSAITVFCIDSNSVQAENIKNLEAKQTKGARMKNNQKPMFEKIPQQIRTSSVVIPIPTSISRNPNSFTTNIGTPPIQSLQDSSQSPSRSSSPKIPSSPKTPS